MKNLKLILLSILILTTGLAKAQNEKAKDYMSNMEKQKKCCPDTSSLISGNTDFANSDLLIEKPNISKNSVTGHYTFTAVVTDNGDDCGYCTKIIILLPAEVGVISYSAKSHNGRKFNVTRCFGTLIIDVGMMCPSEDPAKLQTYFHQIWITVETTDHTTNTTEASFAIMAYSKTPDLKQENNYWYGKK